MRRSAPKAPGSKRPKRRVEGEHCKALIRWRDYQALTRPELKWLHHIPNGAAVGDRQRCFLSAEGLTPGIWDYSLPVRVGDCPGLIIEMKASGEQTTKHGGLSEKQVSYGQHMHEQGWCLAVCYHWGEAVEAIETYLRTGKTSKSVLPLFGEPVRVNRTKQKGAS